jgi:hypothetical protein
VAPARGASSPHLTAHAHRGSPISPATAAAPSGLRSPLAMTAAAHGGAEAKNAAFQSAPLACAQAEAGKGAELSNGASR